MREFTEVRGKVPDIIFGNGTLVDDSDIAMHVFHTSHDVYNGVTIVNTSCVKKERFEHIGNTREIR